MVGATALSLEGLVAVDADVVRLRQGDLNALSELITRYQNRLYRYLLRMVRQPAEAEDLFQQTWLRVVEASRLESDIFYFGVWGYGQQDPHGFRWTCQYSLRVVEGLVRFR